MQAEEVFSFLLSFLLWITWCKNTARFSTWEGNLQTQQSLLEEAAIWQLGWMNFLTTFTSFGS